jgi:hypothetical protein
MKLFQAFGQFAASGALDERGMVFLSRQTFTTATDVNIDNIFSSAYDVYRVLYRVTYSTTLENLSFQYRASGSNVATSNSYINQLIVGFSNSVQSARQTSTSSRFATLDDERPSSGWFDIYNPAKAQITTATSYGGDGDGTARVVQISNHQTGTSALDGLRIFVASGTFTGTFDFYGMRNDV